jgi:DNA transformation protein
MLLANPTAESLEVQLRNIGPTTAQALINAGITTPASLRALGAKEAFLRLHESGAFCGTFHAAYLYALEGAIRDCDWREIPEEDKVDFKAFTQMLRRGGS